MGGRLSPEYTAVQAIACLCGELRGLVTEAINLERKMRQLGAGKTAISPGSGLLIAGSYLFHKPGEPLMQRHDFANND
jgi:hypothetical protein